ncbi:hypothetical protein THAOC_03262 [Thalassiosira oceanica]|uniref:Aminotransferase class V domain-containing protein n=1 Tax=Thalassiosira oceanica TaxID=159749 RepID=K0T8B5_THAOC|nr:hypothetical protein THAOC_03262 [Thalassiosira oceanica]|eukprot:EJK75028.1 hypothetical protein THAOC_03262 [Thalassiosira oceanica]
MTDDPAASARAGERRGYVVTGSAAHSRVGRLFRRLLLDGRGDGDGLLDGDVPGWTDLSPRASGCRAGDVEGSGEADGARVAFLWENAPRSSTRAIRDGVDVYSHLPNGALLDDKWALARLLGRPGGKGEGKEEGPRNDDDGDLAVLESHCFRGGGFTAFAEKAGLLGIPDQGEQQGQQGSQNSSRREEKGTGGGTDSRTSCAPRRTCRRPPRLPACGSSRTPRPTAPAASGSSTGPTPRASSRGGRRPCTRPTGGGGGRGGFDDSVHITNCCANSHDPERFAGEICADLLATKSSRRANAEGDDLPLGEYFPSIAASLAALAERIAPFVRGGENNKGFEYLGLDYVLSSVPDGKGRRRPAAYLLEVNAPPSQDTATGLDRAEALHDEVISDLLRLWVLPNLGIIDRQGGGQRVDVRVRAPAGRLRRRSRRDASRAVQGGHHEQDEVGRVRAAPPARVRPVGGGRRGGGKACRRRRVRPMAQFPYFRNHPREIFFESGGGAQVPRAVADAVSSSLLRRDRSTLGAACRRSARRALSSSLLGGDEGREEDEDGGRLAILGPNATSLLGRLAEKVRRAGLVGEGDEVVVSSENHAANVAPWLELAAECRARVRWWRLSDRAIGVGSDTFGDSTVLSDLINDRTKVVAVSHCSNVLGLVRDVGSVSDLVRERAPPDCQVVVDGVAAAPHVLSAPRGPDWYAVSLHKMAGPHLGCLLGRRGAALRLDRDAEGTAAAAVDDEVIYGRWERGTASHEACAGAAALGDYLASIARWRPGGDDDGDDGGGDVLGRAREAVRRAEDELTAALLGRLRGSSPLVRVVEAPPGGMRVGRGEDGGADDAGRDAGGGGGCPSSASSTPPSRPGGSSSTAASPGWRAGRLGSSRPTRCGRTWGSTPGRGRRG